MSAVVPESLNWAVTKRTSWIGVEATKRCGRDIVYRPTMIKYIERG